MVPKGEGFRAAEVQGPLAVLGVDAGREGVEASQPMFGFEAQQGSDLPADKGEGVVGEVDFPDDAIHTFHQQFEMPPLLTDGRLRLDPLGDVPHHGEVEIGTLELNTTGADLHREGTAIGPQVPGFEDAPLGVRLFPILQEAGLSLGGSNITDTSTLQAWYTVDALDSAQGTNNPQLLVDQQNGVVGVVGQEIQMGEGLLVAGSLQLGAEVPGALLVTPPGHGHQACGHDQEEAGE